MLRFSTKRCWRVVLALRNIDDFLQGICLLYVNFYDTIAAFLFRGAISGALPPVTAICNRCITSSRPFNHRNSNLVLLFLTKCGKYFLWFIRLVCRAFVTPRNITFTLVAFSMNSSVFCRFLSRCGFSGSVSCRKSCESGFQDKTLKS